MIETAASKSVSKTMQKDSQVFELINKELERQRNGIELIASENFTSFTVMQAMGTVPTNKYAEGYPGKRYYGGCEIVDEIETLAIERLKKVFFLLSLEAEVCQLLVRSTLQR